MNYTKPTSINPPGTAFSRLLTALVKGDGSRHHAAEFAEEHYLTSPSVAGCLKSPVAAGMTSDVGWAGALAQYGVAGEAWTLLMLASIFGKLLPQFHRYQFRSKVEVESGAGLGAAWIGEALPIPVRPGSFGTVTLEYSKAQTLTVLTREEFQLSPVAEAAVRRQAIGGVARFADGQLLDPSITATSARPASLTNGAVAVTSSGASAANIITDLSALIAAIATNGDALRWVMRPATYYTICAKLAGVGYPVAPGTLMNIPVVLGANSPRQITLIDCASIATAYDEGVTVDVSTQADLQMTDAPSSSASQMVSLYQSGLVAVKSTISATWTSVYFHAGSPSQPSGVVYMTTSY